MKVYFLRHGDAVPAQEWEGAEADRPLSAKGEKDTLLEGKRFQALGLEFEIALSSPYARAVKTAGIALEAMGLSSRLRTDDRLIPGFGMREFTDIVSNLGELKSLLLVGHEPDFSQTISALIGGARLEVKKGSLARLDIAPGAKEGSLDFLIPPAFLH